MPRARVYRTASHHQRPLPAGMRVLNVGCGRDAYGTQRLDFAPGTTVTERGSCLALPYKDGAFDEVFAGNVLEHMGNPMQFLEECKRVLKPGGKLVLRTDHAAFLGYHFAGGKPGDYHQWHGHGGDRHFMLFNVGHLRNLLEVAGFDVDEVTPFCEWKERTLLGRVLEKVLPWFAASQLWAEAARPALVVQRTAAPEPAVLPAAAPERVAPRLRPAAPLARTR